ncbi:MAG: Flp pilus assembly protein TadD, partial [Verrucomicrobia bacterium]
VAADPNDAEAGLKLASALRGMGEWQRAAEAAEEVTVRHPDSADAFLDLARAHIGAGHGFYAIIPLKRAQALNMKDWRPLSLLGVAYEQITRDDEAEAAYITAEKLAPNNPAVLANLAMFRFGQGKAADAETLLRRAASLPGANEQTRQNLAFVLGRQGRFDEAEKLMRQDLPPDAVTNNLTYLKAAYEKTAIAAPTPAAPSRTWEALKADAG